MNYFCIFLNQSNIHISDSAKISAGVILDASEGPIIIDENVFVDIGVMIKGNTYIGKNSKINPGAKLNGEVSIGPHCKIGGEIEATIFHGYSNKQHDGYIGHSYIGEWVNLGANTNNSDLKNNYGKIKFDLGYKKIDSNEMFIGSMIGDFSKIGISTMLNTGTYIGLGANVFGGDFQDKFIQSFSWGKEDVTDFKKLDQPVLTRKPELIYGLRNIIQNAIEFSKSKVWVEVVYDLSNLSITISDDGKGYPSNLLGKIGEPFLIDTNFKKNLEHNRPYYEGMGLGLFISKTLLENLGATVSFNNEKNKNTGKGAIVTIIFERKKIEVNLSID